MEEKELLEKIDNEIKTGNVYSELETTVYSKLPIIRETVKEHFNVLVSQILEDAIKELGEIKLIYADNSFMPLACLHPLFKYDDSDVFTKGTYRVGFLNHTPLYTSPYIEDGFGYLLNDAGKIFKFKIVA